MKETVQVNEVFTCTKKLNYAEIETVVEFATNIKLVVEFATNFILVSPAFLRLLLMRAPCLKSTVRRQ